MHNVDVILFDDVLDLVDPLFQGADGDGAVNFEQIYFDSFLKKFNGLFVPCNGLDVLEEGGLCLSLILAEQFLGGCQFDEGQVCLELAQDVVALAIIFPDCLYHILHISVEDEPCLVPQLQFLMAVIFRYVV